MASYGSDRTTKPLRASAMISACSANVSVVSTIRLVPRTTMRAWTFLNTVG